MPTKEPSSIITNGGHYFDAKKGTQVLSCTACPEKFVRRSDLNIHMETSHYSAMATGGPISSMNPKLGQQNRIVSDLNDSPSVTIKRVGKPCPASKKRRPGPASRTNAPLENRAISPGNIPSHLEDALFDPAKNGFECQVDGCGKVLQHKQSYLSHMKVIHGNFYGNNKWKGHSSVVDMILEESTKMSPRKRVAKSGADANATMCSVCQQVFPNPSSLRNHVVNVHIQGQDFTCDLCGKAFLSQENLDAHTRSKHPNLNKRLQSLRDALGLGPDDQPPDAKRTRLQLSDLKPNFIGISDSKSTTSLPSTSVLSLSAVNSPSTVLSSSPIVVDFPNSKDCVNNNNVGEVNVDELLAQQSPVDLSKTSTLLNNDKNNNETNSTNNNNTLPPTVLPLDPGAPSGGRKKNSICKVCGVVLSPKTNVNVHMRTHSGARPYQCVLCLNRFRQKAHLMKHFRCSHNQKKPPFICLFCPDECASSNDLYRHITDKHTKETDELTRVNGLRRDPEDEIRIADGPEEPDQGEFQVVPAEPDTELEHEMEPEPTVEPLVEPTVEPIEVDEEDVRYEPITEPFVFEEQIIHPCYVVLPYVTDPEVEAICQRPAQVRVMILNYWTLKK